MLPVANRMRRSGDFSIAVRRGTRAQRGRLVVHQHRSGTDAAPLVGLVVGRAVGGSVVRHRVSRRLRAQLAARLDRLPSGSGTVVRALPGAGDESSRDLGAALDAAFDRLAARA